VVDGFNFEPRTKDAGQRSRALKATRFPVLGGERSRVGTHMYMWTTTKPRKNQPKLGCHCAVCVLCLCVPKPERPNPSPGFVFSINHYANSLSGCPIKPQTARTSQIYGRLNNLPDEDEDPKPGNTNCRGKSREIAKTIKYRQARQGQQQPHPANESKRMQIKIFPLSRLLQDAQSSFPYPLPSCASLSALDGAIKSMCSFTQTFHLPGPPNPHASGILCIGESLY